MKTKTQKIWLWFKKTFHKILLAIKKPQFFIPFIITWLLLESPIIVGVILFIFTKEKKWLGVAGGWYAITAAPLPIPVIPISVGVGTLFEKILRRNK